MPNFLVGSAYAISAGLILFGMGGIIPQALRFPLLVLWATAGIVLAFFAVARKSEKTNKSE